MGRPGGRAREPYLHKGTVSHRDPKYLNHGHSRPLSTASTSTCVLQGNAHARSSHQSRAHIIHRMCRGRLSRSQGSSQPKTGSQPKKKNWLMYQLDSNIRSGSWIFIDCLCPNLHTHTGVSCPSKTMIRFFLKCTSPKYIIQPGLPYVDQGRRPQPTS